MSEEDYPEQGFEDEYERAKRLPSPIPEPGLPMPPCEDCGHSFIIHNHDIGVYGTCQVCVEDGGYCR